MTDDPYNFDPTFNIVNISFESDQPWYWYAPTQQPLNELVVGGWIEGTWGTGNFFDGFIVGGFGPPDKIPPGSFYIPPTNFVQHPARFVLLPCIGISWLDGEVISEFGTLGPVGFDSLEQAVDLGNPDDSEHLGFTPPNTHLLDGAGYGLLPLRTPPLADITSNVPNIWQLTGMPQPPLQDPSKPWDDPNYFLRNIFPAATGSNPYVVSKALANTVVQAFLADWNASSQSADDALPNPNASGVPDGWAFAVPFNGGGGPGTIFAFVGGITEGWGIFPLASLNPATSTRIAVGQLDPKVWDTSFFPPSRR